MRGNLSISILILLLWQFNIALASNGNGYALKISDIEEVLTLKTDSESNSEAIDKINRVLDHLKRRQGKYKSESDFVEYLYYYTHQKLLRRYSEYPTLKETLLDGRYDCLTATATYSILLSELAIEHNVIETNYHVYIIVYPENADQLLIETTDPLNGYIDDQDEISSSRNSYVQSNMAERNTIIDFDFDIERPLEKKELIGLLFYNQSIREANNGHWDKAREIAKMAYQYYSKERVSTLVNIIDSITL